VEQELAGGDGDGHAAAALKGAVAHLPVGVGGLYAVAACALAAEVGEGADARGVGEPGRRGRNADSDPARAFGWLDVGLRFGWTFRGLAVGYLPISLVDGNPVSWSLLPCRWTTGK
jgi:hypothetical protein